MPPKKYIINPATSRPIELYGKQWDYLVKRNILKNKVVSVPVIQFDKDETPEVLEKMKKAMPKQDGTFIVKIRNTLITKNVKLSNEQLIDYIIEKVLVSITDEDTDEQIKEKFSDILHKKLIS